MGSQHAPGRTRIIFSVIGPLLIFAQATEACECHGAPACTYVTHSDVIFLGRVSFSNDNGSGTFVQSTLVRFEVEEAFKGLGPNDHEVWADPGSFTSCYAEYKVGHRYIVFASSKWSWNFSQTAAMTVIKRPGAQKPAPPGFDPAKPPRVYLAPECTGTQEVSDKTEKFVSDDLTFLRDWKQGHTATRVYGRALDDFEPAWPLADPPILQGATVTLTGGSQKLTAVTDPHGAYSFDGIHPGSYRIAVLMDGFRGFPPYADFDVGAGACKYTEFDMVTDGSLEGILKDDRGRPAAGVQLILQRRMPDGKPGFLAFKLTDKLGRFRFTDLPGGDLYLGVNVDRGPTVDQPYPPFYFPAGNQPSAIHLERREHRRGLSFTPPPRLRTRTVEVTVTWADSTPASHADVWARFADGGIAEHAEADKSGYAKLVCLKDFAYRIEAQKWLPGARPGNGTAAHSTLVELLARSQSRTVKLVLATASNDY